MLRFVVICCLLQTLSCATIQDSYFNAEDYLQRSLYSNEIPGSEAPVISPEEVYRSWQQFDAEFGPESDRAGEEFVEEERSEEELYAGEEYVEEDSVVSNFVREELEFQARLNGDIAFDSPKGRFLAPEDQAVFANLEAVVLPRNIGVSEEQMARVYEKYLAVMYNQNMDPELLKPFEEILSRMYNHELDEERD